MKKAFRYNLSDICQRMWAITRLTGDKRITSFAALQAWAIGKLIAEMKERVVCFRYYKKDGTIRVAYGTLMSSMLPSKPQSSQYRPKSHNVCTYWDTEAQAFRSFRNELFIGIFEPTMG